MKKKDNLSYILIGVVIVAVIAVAGSFVLLTNNNPVHENQALLNESMESSFLFVRGSPTYMFSGAWLELMRKNACDDQCWNFTYRFVSAYEGYGNRSYDNATKKPTLHYIEVVVVNKKIMSAIIDEKWDELNQVYI